MQCHYRVPTRLESIFLTSPGAIVKKTIGGVMRYVLCALLIFCSMGAMPKKYHNKKPDNYHRKVVRTCTYEEDIRSGEEVSKEVVPKKKKHRKAKKILGIIFSLGLAALFGPCK